MIDPMMTRRDALEIVQSGSAAVAAAGATADAAVPSARGDGKPGDWDWLTGRWTVRHRKLRDRLAGSSDWVEFDGTSSNWPLLGGAANVEDNVFDMPGETYRGVALRTLDPGTGLWSIHWLDSRFPGQFDVPVRGGFADGVGTFVAEDEWKDTPVMVRFIWSGIAAGAPVWEQAFSTDGGATWEVNWVMHFTRA